MRIMENQDRLSSCLCVFMLACGVMYSVCASPEQKDETCEVVRFDALVEQNYTWGAYHALVFVRYWVARDFSACSVLWMEPHGHNHFNIKSLACMSDDDTFQTYSVGDAFTQTYGKPLTDAEVFPWGRGSYDILHNRFSDQVALSRRVYRQDVAPVLASQRTGVSTVSVSDVPGKPKRQLKRLKVETRSGRVESLDLLDCNDTLMNRVEYEYRAGSHSLSRLSALLPETTIARGVDLEGTVDGEPFLIKTVDMPYHRGGRQCVVDYKPVLLGAREVSLPDRVTVRHARDQTVMRAVRFMNYTRMQADRDTVWTQARAFGPYDADRRKALAFVSKQSKRSPAEVKADSLETLAWYREHFASEFTDANSTVGHRLRAMDSLLRLDPLIADWSAYEQHVQQYMAFLKAQDLDQTLAFGAVKPMRVLLENRRFKEADRILRTWMRDCLPNRPYDIYRLSELLLRNGNYWLANQLIESYLVRKKDQVPVEEAFCLRVLRCQALSGQCASVANRSRMTDPLMRTQCDWALSHIKAPLLQAKLIAGLTDARQLFERLPESMRKEAQQRYVDDGLTRAMMELPDPSRVHKATAQLTGLLKAIQKQVDKKTAPDPPKPIPRPRKSYQRRGDR